MKGLAGTSLVWRVHVRLAKKHLAALKSSQLLLLTLASCTCSTTPCALAATAHQAAACPTVTTCSSSPMKWVPTGVGC